MDDAAPASRLYYKAHFMLDGTIDHPVAGCTDGSTWNGWATPVFDREVALSVMGAVNAVNDEEQIHIRYDADRDLFVIQDPDYPDDPPQTVEGHDVLVDGRYKRLYALGTRAWTWSLSGEAPAPA